MLPSCSSTRRLVIESPRPSPPCARATEESAWRNRSKTCGRNSGLIPWPVSLTISSRWAPARSNRASTRPHGGVNLIAFENRFKTTCCNRSGSPETRASSLPVSTTRFIPFSSADERAEIERPEVERHLARDYPRNVEQVADKLDLGLDGALDLFERRVVIFRTDLPPAQHSDPAQHRRER